MSKAEKFIQDCTRNCSNQYDLPEYFENGIERLKEYYPWLTPDQAKEAAKIARAETIDEVVEWLKKNVTYTHPRKGTKECIVNTAKLKNDLKDE